MKLGVEVVFVTLNKGKSCAIVYVTKNFSTFLFEDGVLKIKVSQGGSFTLAYWLHLNYYTAMSFNP